MATKNLNVSKGKKGFQRSKATLPPKVPYRPRATRVVPPAATVILLRDDSGALWRRKYRETGATTERKLGLIGRALYSRRFERQLNELIETRMNDLDQDGYPKPARPISISMALVMKDDGEGGVKGDIMGDMSTDEIDTDGNLRRSYYDHGHLVGHQILENDAVRKSFKMRSDYQQTIREGWRKELSEVVGVSLPY